MKYRVIADEATVKGFSLLGIDGIVVPNDQDAARKAFESAVSDKSLGALIISSQVTALIGKQITEHKLNGKFPQVIGIGEDAC